MTGSARLFRIAIVRSPLAVVTVAGVAMLLGGARLGGGKGSVLGCVLGVLLVAIIQNGLNLLGVSPYAFKMVVGAFILFAISTSNVSFKRLFRAQ